jgi:hypothetical protein
VFRSLTAPPLVKRFEPRKATLFEIVVPSTVLGLEDPPSLLIPPPVLSWPSPAPAMAELPVTVDFSIVNVPESKFPIAPPIATPATSPPPPPPARLSFRVERLMVSEPLL